MYTSGLNRTMHLSENHRSGLSHHPEAVDDSYCWDLSGQTASSIFWQKYGKWDQPLFRGLAEHVKDTNARYLEPFEARLQGNCPFASGCEVFLARDDSGRHQTSND